MKVDTKNKTCKVCVTTLVVLALVFLGSFGFFLRVLDKVLSGRGLDSYTTFWGIPFNYIGALTVFIAGAVLVVISPILYWFGTREERGFKNKYSIHDQQP